MRLLHPPSRPTRIAPSWPQPPHALSLALGLALIGWLPSHATAADMSGGGDALTLDAVQVRNPFQ
ncbi:hypothetical protein DB820_19540, partial [Xanthomonas perforans]